MAALLEPSVTNTAYQAAQTLLICAIIALVRRTVRRQFVKYWSSAWLALYVGLAALFLSHLEPEWAVPLRVAFCGGEYVFGILVWAGCREYATRRPLGRSEAWIWIAAATLALALPIVFRGSERMFAIHAATMAAFFTAATLSLGRTPAARPRAIGLDVVAAGLLCLTAEFLHYAAVLGLLAPTPGDPRFHYFIYTNLLDILLQLVLAFGMLLVATESVRRELEASNRSLNEATERLKIAARIDPLTGLWNRNGYEAFVQEQSELSGCVAVIDLDDLKPLNDAHGHHAGDAAIQAAGRTLRARTRQSDPVFRWGGDEFLVLLSGGEQADAAARLEEVDRALANLRLPGVPERTSLRISWGTANFASLDKLDEAIASADASMYAKKRAHKKDRPETPARS
ncbi:MAG TPA: GGDEF domain-containing protein [Planctomycetia bacterium]|nr:GGDEF domain-containing protein [Planctomycetia bacterium]